MKRSNRMLGGPVLDKNNVPFGVFKPLILRLEFVKPARRHRCEICTQVFDCHLCSVHHDSSLHAEVKRVASDKPILICPSCIRKNPTQRIVETPQPRVVHVYDHLTGERIARRRVLNRITSKARLAKIPTRSMEVNRQRVEKQRKEWKEKGLCTRCGLDREPFSSFSLCTICRGKIAQSQKEIRERRRRNERI